jgi:hypothetical protein
MQPWMNQIQAAAERAKRRRFVMSGQYLSLHKYLDDRYANRVVLTFGEIEDLLGFMLPDSARREMEWWTDAVADTRGANHSHSWTLAGRTAKANLLAQTVVFDRTSLVSR